MPYRIPNLPFFYIAYRAWSHYRALAGGKHIVFLLQNKLLSLTPSPILDEVYATQKRPLLTTAEPTTDTGASDINPSGLPNPDGETMLLSQANGRRMTQALDLPELEVELERAIWQVETAIKKQSEDEAKAKNTAASAEAQSSNEKKE